MRHVQTDLKNTHRPSPHPTQQRRPAGSRNRRCTRHHGVHMVLAGYNMAWNTIRYLCPMCQAMGLPLVEVATGVVNAYFPQRGYGFIDNGGPRIFFHVTDLVGSFTPYVGQPVTCRVEENRQGLIGREVTVTR